MRGWRYESVRHALAARGIRTGRRYDATLSEVVATLKQASPQAVPMVTAGALATQAVEKKQAPVPVPVRPQVLPVVQPAPTVVRTLQVAPPVQPPMQVPQPMQAGVTTIGPNLFRLPDGVIVTRTAEGAFVPAMAQVPVESAMGMR